MLWHLYGSTTADQYLFGPSAASVEMAATLAGILGKPYVTSWDHEPTQAEVAAALA